MKAHFVIIYREVQKLFIGTGHPYYSFAKDEEIAKECERKEKESQLDGNTETEVDERYAIELMEELEAELQAENKCPSKELAVKKPKVKAKSMMPK